MSIYDDLNNLIDWYEKYKPEDGLIIPVKATEKTISKFARAAPKQSAHSETKWYYRNRQIVPTKITEKK